MPLGDEINQVVPPLNDFDHIQGTFYATLVLMEYGDYQSLQCREAHTLIKSIQAQLGDQLCFVFRHFPQHSQALRAAESAEAAAAQDKFWGMHNFLFENLQHEDADLVQYADQLGLDIQRFLTAMANHSHLPRIQADIESGQQNGVEEVPTFFIGVRHRGTQNLEVVLLALLRSSSPTNTSSPNRGLV